MQQFRTMLGLSMLLIPIACVLVYAMWTLVGIWFVGVLLYFITAVILLATGE